MKNIIFRVGICMAIVMGAGAHAYAQDAEGTRIYYKDGLHIESADGNYTFAIQGRLQTRYTYTAQEQASDQSTFTIPRGEIRLDGNVFTRKLIYGFEVNLGTRNSTTTTPVCTNAACTTTVNAVTQTGTSGFATLNDFYFDWIPIDAIGVKVGQFKVPYLMQELTSSTRLEFPDRSLATGVFNLSRDLGMSIHGSLLNYYLNYAVFFMNGDGANEINRNRHFLMGARVEIPIVGTYKASESDVEYSEKPNFGVGLAYAFNERGSSFELGTIPAYTKAHNGTVDLGFKYKGFSLQASGMVSRTAEGPTVTNWGYSAQAGYFIIPKHLEVALRSDGALFDSSALNQYEHEAGINYYFKGHAIKLQCDYSYLMNVRGPNLNDSRVRAQMQVVF